jgi:ribose transport system permease protein
MNDGVPTRPPGSGYVASAQPLVLGRLFGFREVAILLSVIVAFSVLSLSSPQFLTVSNLVAVALGLSFDAIVVVGMTALLVSGGFDLSVGSVVSLSGAVTAMLIHKAGVAIPFAVIVGLAVGTSIGVANGVLIALVRVNPLITTLATMGLARGAALVLTSGDTTASLPSAFTWIGQGKLLGLQGPFWLMLVVVILGEFLLRCTTFFRRAYYIGSNERAARLAGINVDLTKICLYALTSFLAALSAVVLIARFGAAPVSIGQGMELRVISAAVIGGASLSGGQGSVVGSFLGIALLALISNGLNLTGVSVYWQQLISGGVLLLAVVMDRYLRGAQH